MKARTRLLLPLAAASLLAACATTDDRYMAAAGHSAPGQDAHMVNDAEYISMVEAMAAHRGVKVTWVNPPKVRAGDN
ncbi:MAG TPA: hypothetical protein VFM73_06490 [Xanthomonadaceae bacterium]|nr:hypothetical protein [Xanthomonadaceae bacterium]